VSRASFYRWKAIYQEKGEDGLKQRKPIAKDHPRRIPQDTVAKVIELRTQYHLGQRRIGWYLERYHGIRLSQTSIHRIFDRNGLRRLPKTADRRALHTRRYAKRVPGHHIQMDVKILNLTTDHGTRVWRAEECNAPSPQGVDSS
jgi:hypothetical protein